MKNEVKKEEKKEEQVTRTDEKKAGNKEGKQDEPKIDDRVRLPQSPQSPR